LRKQWRKKRLLRRVLTFAVIVAMFSLFGMFLHYIAVDHPPRESVQDFGPNE